METKLFFEETEDTPLVNFNSENGELEIVGRSLPEDATSFYGPIIKWLTDYLKKDNSKTTFHIKLEYFNSSSAKQLLQLILLLEKYFQDGKNVKIIWYYSNTDELIESRGKELKSLVDIPFELKKFN